MNEIKPGKKPLIQNLMPGLTEIGKIKIGCKGAIRQGQGGAYQQPVKLDHFIVTTLERDGNKNFCKNEALYKELKLPAEPKRIPINLLFDDISLNFQCRYSCYFGKTLFCSGDGEYAMQMADKTSPARKQVDCPCHRQDPTFNGDKNDGKGKCKINGTLSVLITGANCVGGVWKFRTTGYNSTVGILSSLTLLKSLTNGVLAGIPLVMTIQPKVATNPLTGESVTIQVVGVEYAGTITDLQKSTLQIAEQNANFRMRLAHVEDEARRLISVDADLVDQAGDIVDEFMVEEQPAPKLASPEQAPPSAPAATTQAPATPPAAEPTKKTTRKKKEAATAQVVPEQTPQPPAPEPAQAASNECDPEPEEPPPLAGGENNNAFSLFD